MFISISMDIVFVLLINCTWIQTVFCGVVLEPVKSGNDVGMVIVALADIQAEQYIITGNVTQMNSDRRLWVYLADGYTYHRALDASEGQDLHDLSVNVVNANDSIVGAAKQALVDAGMAEDAPFFAVGHSLAGITCQLELMQYPDLVQGLVLWASYRTYDFSEFPWPVFTLSGDLDGQTKLTTVLLINREMLSDIRFDPALTYQFPTHIMEGVNHAAYASGPMPPVVLDQDIPAYLEDDVMKQLIAVSTAVFIDYHSRPGSDDGAREKEAMDAYYNHTVEVSQPIYEIFDMEQDPATNLSHWAVVAQTLVSGLTGECASLLRITDDNVQNDMISEFQPEMNLTPEGYVNITIITSVVRQSLDGYDAAAMLESKMKSSEAIEELLHGVYQPGVINTTCRHVNMESWETAYMTMPQLYRDRCDDTDVIVIFEEDEQEVWGPGWVMDDLFFDFNRTELILRIQSSSLWTSVNGTIYPGNYYCKLLSPAKAMEFMYVDCLRERYD